MPNPIYPVYVISKGRWESRLTVRSLEELGVPFTLVVEPQEADSYRAAVRDPACVAALPFSNLGLGSIPARNWVWDDAVQRGAARHWILDDNIGGFYRLHENRRTRFGCGTCFRAAEVFADRYENVAIAGFQYMMFAPRKRKWPAFVWNTRVYSCILLRNDLQWQGAPMRWRGRYNEDTDLSLRALKDGHCTVLFNAFLANKMATMTMGGGNTDELYSPEDGRLLMAQSLVDQHPDVVTINYKWKRPQHEVNYRPFKNNKPIMKAGIVLPDDTEFPLVMRRIV